VRGDLTFGLAHRKTCIAVDIPRLDGVVERLFLKDNLLQREAEAAREATAK
jgi:hypothetical protein